MRLKRKSNWDFYGVKIIRQILLEGQPDLDLVKKVAKDLDLAVDELLEDNYKQSFEESIMLVRAQSYQHACKIAEKKAKEFVKPGLNPYGQNVTWEFVKVVDCYWIIDDLVTGAEVYSCFHDTDKNITTDEFINKWFVSVPPRAKQM
jgi:hypothetical protein